LQRAPERKSWISWTLAAVSIAGSCPSKTPDIADLPLVPDAIVVEVESAAVRADRPDEFPPSVGLVRDEDGVEEGEVLRLLVFHGDAAAGYADVEEIEPFELPRYLGVGLLAVEDARHGPVPVFRLDLRDEIGPVHPREAPIDVEEQDELGKNRKEDVHFIPERDVGVVIEEVSLEAFQEKTLEAIFGQGGEFRYDEEGFNAFDQVRLIGIHIPSAPA
jgi:hypothetical protein